MVCMSLFKASHNLTLLGIDFWSLGGVEEGAWVISVPKVIERPKVNSQQRQQLCDALNKDLQTISELVSQWLVAFNSSKTQSILHSRLKDDGAPCNLQMSSNILQEKDSISLLGLTVSGDLSWKSDLRVSKKAAQPANRQFL